jgi:hypothetical protein
MQIMGKYILAKKITIFYKTYLKFLREIVAKCLKNNPLAENKNSSSILNQYTSISPGQIWTPDDQCKMIYGNKSYFCRVNIDSFFLKIFLIVLKFYNLKFLIDVICTTLYCYTDSGCLAYPGNNKNVNNLINFTIIILIRRGS